MSCNILSYLDEQRVVCLRLARAANEGSPGREQWLKNAQVLLDRAEEHKVECVKCKNN